MMGRVSIRTALLCVMLLLVAGQAFGAVTTLVDIPMDAQVGPGGIFCVNNTPPNYISFEPANPPDEPTGFTRMHIMQGASYFYGPYIDFQPAYGNLGNVDISDPWKLFRIEIDLRYYQASPATPIDAPAWLRLYMMNGTSISGGYRSYDRFVYAQNPGYDDPAYPAWTHKSIELNCKQLRAYTDTTSGGAFTGLWNRLRFYGTDWAGTGADYFDAKNFKITAEDIGRVAGVVNDTKSDLVAGALVTLTPGGRTATTAADGTYAIEAVSPGTYDVTVTHALYATQTHTAVGIAAGATTTQNFTLFPTSGWIYGTVTDGSGNPMPQAIVGIKTSAKATADAQTYLVADNAGKFAKQVGNGTYYVGAWTYGYMASADVTVTVVGNDHTISVPITTKAGANIAIGATATATSVDPANGPGNAINGNYGDRWISVNPLTIEEQDQTLTVDLGSVKDIAGFTIWWENAYASDYTVDITTGDPTTGPWTSVYAVTGGAGGWATGYGQNIDPIYLAAPIQARAVRIHATKFGPYPVYSVWELVVHGTTPDANVQSRISAVKALPDGTPVDLWKEVSVSGTSSTGDSTIYRDYFWYQEYDRTAGIKVHRAAHGSWPGELNRTVGTVETDAVTGERYIEATQDIQYLGWGGTTFAPLGLNNRAATINQLPVGLIVTMWGKVTGVDVDRNWFTISDGSGFDVKVFRAASRADVGTFVTVTGALGAEPAIYEPMTNGIVTKWLFNGSYSVADPDPLAPTGDPSDPTAKWHTWQGLNLAEDFLATVGGEANIAPKPGDAAPKGTWFVASKDNGEFDLGSMPWVGSGANQRCEYASVWFYSPGTYKYSTDGLTAWVASDDGYKLWVNGVVAGENNIWRGLNVGTADEIQAGDPWSGEDTWTLTPGWNHVLCKINDITGGHSFYVKFTVRDAVGNVVPLSLPASVSSW